MSVSRMKYKVLGLWKQQMSQGRVEDKSTRPPRAGSPLRRLQPLVGTWTIIGRTLDVHEDNIRGRVSIDWLLDGQLMHQRGELRFRNLEIKSLEIVCYDPVTKSFPSYVYSSVDDHPRTYLWEIRRDTVTHSGLGVRFTGTFSPDGRKLTGGWRPEHGTETSAGNSYDVTMNRGD